MAKTRGFSINPLYVVILLLFLGLLGGGFYGYRQLSSLKQENQRLSNPEEATKSEIEKTKFAVANLYEVPTDEDPTIANVVDVTKLSNQPFFNNAKNGDKLLVYQKAQKAILYRPDTNKIIEVSTISTNGSTSEKTSADSKKSSATTDQSNQSSVDASQPGLGQ